MWIDPIPNETLSSSQFYFVDTVPSSPTPPSTLLEGNSSSTNTLPSLPESPPSYYLWIPPWLCGSPPMVLIMGWSSCCRGSGWCVYTSVVRRYETVPCTDCGVHRGVRGGWQTGRGTTRCRGPGRVSVGCLDRPVLPRPTSLFLHVFLAVRRSYRRTVDLYLRRLEPKSPCGRRDPERRPWGRTTPDTKFSSLSLPKNHKKSPPERGGTG